MVFKVIIIEVVITTIIYFIRKGYISMGSLRKYWPKARAYIYRLYSKNVIDRKYSAKLLAAVDEVFVLLSVIDDPKTDEEKAADVATVIYHYYRILNPEDKDNAKKAKATANAVYLVLLNNKELLYNIRAIGQKHYGDIEVKKLTLLSIDTIGAFFNLKNKLDSEFFQHIIYGINKCLLIIRDRGVNKNDIDDLGAVMFRMYKLASAYGMLKGSQKMSKEAFYAKVTVLISRLIAMYN